MFNMDRQLFCFSLPQSGKAFLLGQSENSVASDKPMHTVLLI